MPSTILVRVLVNNISSNCYEFVFLGIQSVNDTLQWSDFTKPRYTNWMSGQPTGSNPSAAITDDGSWTEIASGVENYALCEKGKLVTSL